MLDIIPVSQVDVAGLYAMRDVRQTLIARGVKLVFAGHRAELIQWARQVGAYSDDLAARSFSTMRQALKAYRQQERPAQAPPAEE